MGKVLWDTLYYNVDVDTIIPAWQIRAHSLAVCKATLTARPSRLFKNGPRGVFLLYIIFYSISLIQVNDKNVCQSRNMVLGRKELFKYNKPFTKFPQKYHNFRLVDWALIVVICTNLSVIFVCGYPISMVHLCFWAERKLIPL